MFSFRAGLTLLISAALLAPSAIAASVRRNSTSHASRSHKPSHVSRKTRRGRGQQAIDADRVTQIQQALIREHYLTGDASGSWDSSTVAAMQKYQADHGWQTKLTPDSRALKSLGLGPDYSTALNASGSSFAAPPPNPAPASNSAPSQDSGFIAASRVSQ